MRSGSSDRTRGAELRYSIRRESEQPAIDFVVVLADSRRASGRANRGRSHFGERSGERKRAAERVMRHRDPEVAGLQLFVLGDIGGVGDRGKKDSPLESLRINLALGHRDEKVLNRAL